MVARVLVVDDHFLNVKLLEARLQLASYDVITASGGAEALEKVELQRPDIVLLDVMMPGMNGYEVCRRIRANPASASLPVIMVTALDKESDRAEGMAAGADDFLNKPVADDELFPAMTRHLQKPKSTAVA